MDLETASDRAERAVDVAAAAVFSAAIGGAAWALAADNGPAIAGAAAAAFWLAHAILRRVPADERIYAVPGFELPAIEPIPEEEDEAGAELLLDDMLGGVEPDARVVRLFDPGPGPGRTGEPPAAPDASEALSEALAELRRSLS